MKIHKIFYDFIRITSVFTIWESSKSDINTWIHHELLEFLKIIKYARKVNLKISFFIESWKRSFNININFFNVDAHTKICILQIIKY